MDKIEFKIQSQLQMSSKEKRWTLSGPGMVPSTSS